MKFVLFVEGKTERVAVPSFTKRWLDVRLKQPVGMKVVKFNGWPEFDREIKTKADSNLSGPSADDVIAGIGLLDLYGPTFYPADKATAKERIDWATKKFEVDVNHGKFRMFLAVHEVEAWLLSQPDVFPSAIAAALSGKYSAPETVNFGRPPARLLAELYRTRLKRGYKKVTYGRALFAKLDPEAACRKCPNLQAMLETMLDLARRAGL